MFLYSFPGPVHCVQVVVMMETRIPFLFDVAMLEQAPLMACGALGVQYYRRALLLSHLFCCLVCEGGAAPQLWIYKPERLNAFFPYTKYNVFILFYSHLFMLYEGGVAILIHNHSLNLELDDAKGVASPRYVFFLKLHVLTIIYNWIGHVHHHSSTELPQRETRR